MMRHTQMQANGTLAARADNFLAGRIVRVLVACQRTNEMSRNTANARQTRSAGQLTRPPGGQLVAMVHHIDSVAVANAVAGDSVLI